MYRVLAIATLLLLAPLATGEAEGEAPVPALQSKGTDSPAASPSAKSPASNPEASSPAPAEKTAPTPAKAPATSLSTAPASYPFVGSVVPERQIPSSSPMPSAGESQVEAPGPSAADEKSGSVRSGAVLGGAMAACVALAAF